MLYPRHQHQNSLAYEYPALTQRDRSTRSGTHDDRRSSPRRALPQAHSLDERIADLYFAHAIANRAHHAVLGGCSRR